MTINYDGKELHIFILGVILYRDYNLTYFDIETIGDDETNDVLKHGRDLYKDITQDGYFEELESMIDYIKDKGYLK